MPSNDRMDSLVVNWGLWMLALGVAEKRGQEMGGRWG